MGILSKIGGALIGGGLAATVDTVADAVDRFVETPEEKAAAAIIRQKMLQEPQRWQAEINKEEAKHKTLFVAGWRPGVGWVCAISLFLFFVPQYSIGAILWAKHSWASQMIQPYPISPDAIMELVFAMLGMATLRGIEKFGGKTK